MRGVVFVLLKIRHHPADDALILNSSDNFQRPAPPATGLDRLSALTEMGGSSPNSYRTSALYEFASSRVAFSFLEKARRAPGLHAIGPLKEPLDSEGRE